VIEQYRDVDGVKIFHTKNCGQGSARNLGVSAATGGYIYFFDADDLLDPDFVASMHALVGPRPDVDIIYFSGQSFLDTGCRSDYMPSYERKMEWEFASGIEATGALLQHEVYFASPCLYLSKKRLWDDNNLAFMSIVHEDEEIIMRLSCAAGTSLCIKQPFFQRRIRSGSTMTVPKSKINAIGYLRTLVSIASYCKMHRTRVAPILPDLVRRFYNFLRGYLAICRAINARPDYKKIFLLLIKLGRLPSLRQLYEIWIPPAMQGRVSYVKRKLSSQG
jgi:glycosyltransferase involved in cell wall biosynthesis